MKQVIAIDGPSGAGKTTIARLIAEELDYRYLDTGALYRAVAFGLRKSGIRPEDSDEIYRETLAGLAVTYQNGRVFLNGSDVSDLIRSKEMDHYSSVFSARKSVRDFLLDLQRGAALQHNLVVEGRDTTTVVFPDASKKIFLDASVETRAQRRYAQFRDKGGDMSLEEARKGIIERDMRDAGRDIAPLRVATDALLIDSSHLSIEQVKNRIVAFAKADP